MHRCDVCLSCLLHDPARMRTIESVRTRPAYAFRPCLYDVQLRIDLFDIAHVSFVKVKRYPALRLHQVQRLSASRQVGVRNLPTVDMQLRRDRRSNRRPGDSKSGALPLRHHATISDSYR